MSYGIIKIATFLLWFSILGNELKQSGIQITLSLVPDMTEIGCQAKENKEL